MRSRFSYVFERTWGHLGLDELDEYHEVIDALSEHLSSAKSGIALHNRAVAYWEIGEIEKALHDFKAAVEELPRDYLPAQLQGMLLRELNHLPEALASFDQAISTGPDAPSARMCRGHMLMDAGRFADALADFKHALRCDPSSKPAQNGLDSALDKLRESAPKK